jgi:epimerase transport system membrane fusion protein
LTHTVAVPGASGPTAPAPPSDSATGAVRAGWLIILLVFGGFGLWAATAPLNAAVVGEAVVKVEGNRKSIQHLDGGTVKDILVKDGDRVRSGDVLMILDDTSVRADVDILGRQYLDLLATEARLRTEYDGGTSVNFPAELSGAEDVAVAADAMASQQEEFASRADALLGKEAVLQQRIGQYEQQIVGMEAQRAPLQAQLSSVAAERASLTDLLKKGLTTRTRVLELERREETIGGQAAEIAANIATSRGAISEFQQEIAQLQRERMAEVSGQLREVRGRLLDVLPRLRAAKISLDRLSVRTPYAGKVVDLAVFSVGAVIGRGERLADIVPDETSLIIEAKVRVEDIADITPGMTAEVHFTSYKQRITPLIHGVVSEISADRLTDERTQVPYYLTQVEVDAVELAASPEIQLYPGMPATVMITTKERTALDYLIGPLFASFDRSFKER